MKKYILLIVSAAVLAACETKLPEFTYPRAMTSDATDVTSTSAVLYGYLASSVIDHCYVRRAFEVWKEFGDDEKTTYYLDEDYIRMTSSNMSMFSLNVTGLEPTTTYNFRVVLQKFDSNLSDDIYGQTLSFSTSSQPKPSVSVTTLYAQSVTSRTARVSGSAIATNTTLTEIGFVRGNSDTELTLSNYIYRTYSTYIETSFNRFWYDLRPGMTYAYRAYAIDAEGTVHYGNQLSFTTKSEPGGSLTKDDFIGTYSATVYMPWQDQTQTWYDVQIIPYNGDTVVATGWNGRNELRALGIFEPGLQVVRFESNWYFEPFTFDVNGYNCVAQFMPIYYNSSDQKAYLLKDGGLKLRGEIWLRLSSGIYTFGTADGDSSEGYYANGFIFDYYTPSDWTKRGNSAAFINVSMTRTSTTTTRPLPSRKVRDGLKLNSTSNNANETTDNWAVSALDE